MYSMTGFGSASTMHEPYKINVEIKSLNSKFTDVRFKAPPEFSMLEMEVRQQAMEIALRGKIEISLTLEGQNMEGSLSEVDEQVFSNYYHQLDRLSNSLGADSKNIVSAILQLPGVVKLQEFKVDKDMKSDILNAIEVALGRLMNHRKKEGQALESALSASIQKIVDGQERIAELESERMENVRTRLSQNLEQHIPPEKIDNGRYEQELVYYLDKMDIHEEMIRLKQHCVYFMEELRNEDSVKGKKLNFIGQEIGREINTLGAKANHSDIQRLVVEMKNELDKIKEQLANVL
ncbi:YicC family protein [Membranicola marinus]|uniref:YicC family protein n=1 Tax=Membranihabitans marinus TaxID=1227546 RepID=A0A953L956_9BACT|nr:YicC/YloC family endoribonuclease [Membranihabitans marinus]MBY5958470.1 YicC family protein [Membranihabitans marinus]